MMKRVLSFILVLAMTLGLVMTAPLKVHAESQMMPSDECIRYLKSMEGFAAIPFWDYSQWTVGFGTRCPEDKRAEYTKNGIPMEEAHALFAREFVGYYEFVNNFLDRKGLTLNQAQFDALVCLVYNKGGAWMNNDNDPLVIALMEGDTSNRFIAAMTASCMAGGEYLPGLMRRRLTEVNMFLNGIYSVYAPDYYCHVVYDAGNGKSSVPAQGYDCNLFAEPLATATYTGYRFLGWYTAKTGGVKVTMLDENTNGMTLYAHWEKEGQGGTGTEGETTIATVKVTGNVVNVRSGPGINYSIVGSVREGAVLTITKIQDVDGILWGKFENGWLSLAYTDYEKTVTPEDPVDPPEKDDPVDTLPALPMTGVVVGVSELKIYNGPHTSYPQVGTYKLGETVKIVEVYELFGVIWGKTDKGWVRTDKHLLFDNYSSLAHSFNVTVTNQYVFIRSGPGTNYSSIDTAYKGAKMTITSIVQGGGYTWGKFSEGWVALDYTNYDSSKLDSYMNHSYGAWKQIQAPTCTAVGQERRDCSACDHFEVRDVAVSDHTYGDWTLVSGGTCTTPGKEQAVCSGCGDVKTRDTELGLHSLGQWYVVTQATCAAEGQERRDCEYCDYHETQTTPVGDHVYGEWFESKAPTAEEAGEERRDCTVCDHFETRVLEPTEHVYGNWYEVKAPTCAEPGEIRRDCTHCELVETREVPAAGHSFGDWTEVTAPTCNAEGQQKRVCAVCGAEETQSIPTTDHVYGDWSQVQVPSCVVEGQEKRICTVCGHEETRVIPVSDHVYGEWELIKAPTCSTEGQQKRTCTVCGHEQVQAMTGSGHAFGDWTQAIAPTCNAEGLRKRTCALCGAEETEPIATVAHTFSNWNVKTEPTCAAEGMAHRVCEICAHVETKTLEKNNDHSFGEWELVIAPTEAEPGQEKRTCSLCGAEEVREVAYAAPVEKTYATLTGYSYLNVRSGPGTGYTKVGQLKKGDRVEVLEQRYVGANLWIHFEMGWAQATGYMTLETVMEQPQPPVVEPDPPVVEPDPPVTVEKVYATITTAALNVRTGPGTHNAFVTTLVRGTRVEVLEQQMVGAQNWGKTSYGWICLTGYTTLETVTEEVEPPVVEPEPPVVEPEPPVTTVTKTYGTLTGYEFLRIRAGAGTGYAQVGMLKLGDRFEIFEQRNVDGSWWGRIAEGWVCLTGYVTVEYVEEQVGSNSQPQPEQKPAEPVTKTYATLTGNSYLNIRAGAGTGYAWAGKLTKGDRVEILEQKTVGSQVWGRIDRGWICLTGYMTLETVTE